MALDPSIALQAKPIQLEDPLAQYGKVAAIQNAQNQNALAQYQLATARREDAAKNALNTAYQQSYDPSTGKVDINKLRQTLATGGFGSQLPALEKTFSEMESAALTRDTSRANLERIQRENRQAKANQAVTDIAGMGTPDEALVDIDRKLAAGDIDEAKAAMLKNSLTSAPSFADWKKGMITNILSAKDRLTLEKPMVVGSSLMTPQGTIVATAPRKPELLTPDEEAQKIRIALGSRPEPTPAAPVAVIDPVTGKPVYVSRERAIAEGLAPVKGAEEDKLTEAQGKATGFAMRAKEAHQNLNKLDFSPYVVATKQATEQAPVIGGLAGAAMNIGMSPTNQKADQAQREFVNAVLRQESGAAINQAEFENARRQYFPQPGDSKEVVKQKQKNRETAIKSLEIAAGSGMKKAKNVEKSALSGEDKQALDWANANPNDPRAAKIKQKLGVE